VDEVWGIGRQWTKKLNKMDVSTVGQFVMISDASLAISQPYCPIQKPTSAYLRASTSFRPSAVTATEEPAV
jgi:hypothetical protein